MNDLPSPFLPRPGFAGVVASLSDKRWYLRDWHSHPALEVNLVLRGSGHVLLENRRYPLLPGHLVWLWPGQRHVPSLWSADMLLWVVEWNSPSPARLLASRRKDSPPPGVPAIPYCRRLSAPALRRIDGLLSSVASCSRPDAFNRGLDFALLALWDEFLAAECVRDCSPFHPKLQAVLALLADPDRRISQSRLAKAVQLAPAHLGALFKTQTGLSLPAYRNQIRLQEFFRRIHAHPEIRMLQHALDSGFGSYAQFFRVFSKAIGATPRQWRSMA